MAAVRVLAVALQLLLATTLVFQAACNDKAYEQQFRRAEIDAATEKAEEKAKHIRSRYSAAVDIVRDTAHLQHDLETVIELTGDGTFTTEESIFYLMRMHDFDDNNQLDGLELMQVFGHAMQHRNGGQPLDADTLTAAVDETLRYDADNNGLLSYAEWLHGYRSEARSSSS